MKNLKVVSVFIGLVLLAIFAYLFITKILPFLVFVAILFFGFRWIYKKLGIGSNGDTTETKS